MLVSLFLLLQVCPCRFHECYKFSIFPCVRFHYSVALIIDFLGLTLRSWAQATMPLFLRLLYLPFLCVGLSVAGAAYNASSSTFDVFKYVDQLIGTNDYGIVALYMFFSDRFIQPLFLIPCQEMYLQERPCLMVWE